MWKVTSLTAKSMKSEDLSENNPSYIITSKNPSNANTAEYMHTYKCIQFKNN